MMELELVEYLSHYANRLTSKEAQMEIFLLFKPSDNKVMSEQK